MLFFVSRAFWMNILAMLLIVAGGIYAVALFLDSYTKHDEFVEVPDFEGFHYSEIDEYISDKNLRFEIVDSLFNPNKEGGIVLEQIPEKGELVKPNRKIYITINSVTPPSVILPELHDITVRQVVSKIETYGLNIDSLIYRPAECDNCVIGVLFEGKEVTSGTRIEKGKSISLIIGEGIGMEKVSIPFLYKHSLAEVREMLNSQGLNVGFYEFDSTVTNIDDSANAFVYRQIPVYDTVSKVRQGRAFDLFLTMDSNKIEGIELMVPDTNLQSDEDN